jgi:hypothetical protein
MDEVFLENETAWTTYRAGQFGRQDGEPSSFPCWVRSQAIALFTGVVVEHHFRYEAPAPVAEGAVAQRRRRTPALNLVLAPWDDAGRDLPVDFEVARETARSLHGQAPDALGIYAATAQKVLDHPSVVRLLQGRPQRRGPLEARLADALGFAQVVAPPRRIDAASRARVPSSVPVWDRYPDQAIVFRR